MWSAFSSYSPEQLNPALRFGQACFDLRGAAARFQVGNGGDGFLSKYPASPEKSRPPGIQLGWKRPKAR
jgi:hypothetical protein